MRKCQLFAQAINYKILITVRLECKQLRILKYPQKYNTYYTNKLKVNGIEPYYVLGWLSCFNLIFFHSVCVCVCMWGQLKNVIYAISLS